MQKTSRFVKAFAGVAALGLGCLAVVYAAEIVAFFGSHSLWVLGGLAVWIAVSLGVGLLIGAAVRNRDSQQPAPAPAAAQTTATDAASEQPVATTPPAAIPHIPSPTVAHESEQGVPLKGPTRSELSTR